MQVSSVPQTEEDKFGTEYSEVTVINPAEPGRGVVFVTSYGEVYWTCMLRAEPDDPEGLSIDELGRTVAGALTNAPPASLAA